MGLRFMQRDQKTINFIFTDHAIRYLEVKQRSPLIVQQYGERLLDSGIIKDGRIIDKQHLTLILQNIVDELGVKKRPVRFIVPDSTIAIRKLTIPSDIRDDEVKGYIFLEIGTTIHLPFEEPNFDVVILPGKNKKKEVLLVATEEEVIQSYLSLLEDVSLKPVVADVSPLSLYRLNYKNNFIHENDHVMLLHFDESLLTISIFHQHIPLFMRPIAINEDEDVSLSSLTQNSVENNEIYQLDEIVKDIGQIMSFYQFTIQKGEHQVNRILLSGDHSQRNMIREYLTDRLEISIDQLPSEVFQPSSDVTIPRSYSIALGLGLKEVH